MLTIRIYSSTEESPSRRGFRVEVILRVLMFYESSLFIVSPRVKIKQDFVLPGLFILRKVGNWRDGEMQVCAYSENEWDGKHRR